MNPPTHSRRGALRLLGGAGLGLLLTAPAARLAFALPVPPLPRAGFGAPGRVVWVLLRGGLDGLYAVPATGDPHFATARGPLALFAEPPLALDSRFSMHPSLGHLHGLYTGGKLAIVHAVASPCRDRSHFDAQQMLESGGTKPYLLNTGFLGRAIQANGRRAVGMASNTPLSLRGSDRVDTWSPSRLQRPDDELLERVARLYVNDPTLASALVQARSDLTRMSDDAEGSPTTGLPITLAREAATRLRAPDGPTVAMLELSGWDSHAQQAAPNGRLIRSLKSLDAVVDTLVTELGDVFEQTVIVVASEFGRAVATNGTQGTDHGTGGVCFVLGGGVRGGRVLGDWPGLATGALYEGRDLRPTTDLRGVFKAVLGRQLGLSAAALASEVFPESAAVGPLPGLFG